ncbi:hypothetical protein LX32DRAFT_688460 [Colletotrichum zoysiae]|uniref:Uncharacterized protein n=1 Tax=Colletotrichum zoysiae TaxID=1216348 RepID=A0AAD9MAL5_9PEZI|nr:hypothetical protein LX32DRAFT_688460 [Colletotrichum zoysiae]
MFVLVLLEGILAWLKAWLKGPANRRRRLIEVWEGICWCIPVLLVSMFELNTWVVMEVLYFRIIQSDASDMVGYWSAKEVLLAKVLLGVYGFLLVNAAGSLCFCWVLANFTKRYRMPSGRIAPHPRTVMQTDFDVSLRLEFQSLGSNGDRPNYGRQRCANAGAWRGDRMYHIIVVRHASSVWFSLQHPQPRTVMQTDFDISLRFDFLCCILRGTSGLCHGSISGHRLCRPNFRMIERCIRRADALEEGFYAILPYFIVGSFIINTLVLKEAFCKSSQSLALPPDFPLIRGTSGLCYGSISGHRLCRPNFRMIERCLRRADALEEGFYAILPYFIVGSFIINTLVLKEAFYVRILSDQTSDEQFSVWGLGHFRLTWVTFGVYGVLLLNAAGCIGYC